MKSMPSATFEQIEIYMQQTPNVLIMQISMSTAGVKSYSNPVHCFLQFPALGIQRYKLQQVCVQTEMNTQWKTAWNHVQVMKLVKIYDT